MQFLGCLKVRASGIEIDRCLPVFRGEESRQSERKARPIYGKSATHRVRESFQIAWECLRPMQRRPVDALGIRSFGRLGIA